MGFQLHFLPHLITQFILHTSELEVYDQVYLQRKLWRQFTEIVKVKDKRVNKTQSS